MKTTDADTGADTDYTRSREAFDALNLNLLESEERYRTLFDLVPVSVYGPVLVALTGWGQADRRRSEDAGFDAHLVKPVDDGVLDKLLVELRTGSAAR